MTRVAEWVAGGGIRLWSAVLAGLGAWAVHLTFLASFVQFSCNRDGVAWVPHAVTAATAAVTVAAMAVCAALTRHGNGAATADDDVASVPARTRFLGRLGVLCGAVNLLLILAEGAYVEAVHRCG